MPDEVFRGHCPDDAILPTEELMRTDALIPTGIISGEPRLFYSATILTTGNGIVNADFALTGLPAGVLFSVPFVCWFSPLHRQTLKFGWWNTTLRFGVEVQKVRRVRSWYEAAAIPVAEFLGSAMGNVVAVRASLYAPPGQARLVQMIQFQNRTATTIQVTLTMSGAARPGEEAGSFYDPVHATVGRRTPLNPVTCTTKVDGNAVNILNEHGHVFVRLEGTGQLVLPKFTTRTVQLHFPRETMNRPTLQFEVSYKMAIEPNERKEHVFSVTFANNMQELSPGPTTISFEAARDMWRQRLASVEAIQTPDKRFTMGLRRSAAYSISLGYEIAGRQELIFHADHMCWPVDCARDSYHIANSLLLIEPALVKKHLRFYFLDAIPNAGPGKSYIGKGVSRGMRQARLLDLAAYPMHELYRYWRATGDDAFVANPEIRKAVEKLVAEISTWQAPETGLFTSTERSSDERCVHPYFIPGNMLMVATLERMVEIYDEIYHDVEMREKIAHMAHTCRQAIYQRAVVKDAEFGEVFAFEVDTDGNFLLYDHADIPNLLSAPRFGFCRVDDPVYQNTLRFIYSGRNQGYRGTMDGKYAALCDGSKTLPFGPWPLGTLGHLMSCCTSRQEARRLVEWIRDCLTTSYQLPEICDKHTGQPMQRLWFGWPTAMLLMAYIETLCGVKIGKEITFEPLAPEGWAEYRSPILTIRGERCQIVVTDGVPHKHSIGA